MRLNVDWLEQLLDEHVSPCISIYLPVYRADPPAAENARQYRDQLDKVRASLAQNYTERDIRPIMEKLEAVPDDPGFWTADRDAIAIFVSPDVQQVINLQRPADPAVFVSDTFHIKPLIRVLQSDWNYHVLAFSQRQVRVFLGSGESRLVPLDASNIPQSPDDVSKMRMSHTISATADMQTANTQNSNEGQAAMPVPLETFMRAVDKAVWESFSRAAKYPLIFCAVEEYHAQFRAICKNQYLLDEGVKYDPQHVDLERIRKEAWAIMQPRFQAQVEDLKNQFMAAKAHHKGSDELVPVAEAVAIGRVDTLLVDAQRQVPGRVDRQDGRLVPAQVGDPVAGDVLDDLAEMVLRTHGEVLVLPPDMMPGNAQIAAIFRY